MQNSCMGSIIEGLANASSGTLILEGSSNFSARLDSFLKGQDSETVGFIKKVINSIYLGLKADYGGYFEGKRAIVKDSMGYKTITWKMQTNKSTRYEFYNIMRKYMSKVANNEPFSLSIDGNAYYVLAYTDSDTSSRSFQRDLALDKYVFVGVDSVSSPNQKVDPSKEGDTFKFIVSLPISDFNVNNPNVKKDGTEYYFSGKGDYTLTYSVSRKRFSLSTGSWSNGDLYEILYKPSRQSEACFKHLYSHFDKNMTSDEVKKILKDFNVRISTSYYPGLD